MSILSKDSANLFSTVATGVNTFVKLREILKFKEFEDSVKKVSDVVNNNLNKMGKNHNGNRQRVGTYKRNLLNGNCCYLRSMGIVW